MGCTTASALGAFSAKPLSIAKVPPTPLSPRRNFAPAPRRRPGETRSDGADLGLLRAQGRSAGLSTPHGPSSIAGRSKWLAVAGRTPLLVRAGGFGDSGSKRKEAAVQGNRKAQPTSRAPQTKQAGAGIAPPAPGGSTNVAGWTKCEISKAPGDLDIVPTILNNKGFVIINADDKLYAMEANCPSCKYPIVKGTVTSAMETGTAELPSGSVECPLCKSEFWLENGGVKAWCPEGKSKNLFGGLMSNLNKKSTPTSMNVYMAKVEGSTGYIKFG
mmetsp:Transcript_64812/g.204652  ORF Transcript_64812/g.204652 Transcript_64812/m.204652 type:complete len:273 (+) Transcript_64812:550-1368(+)